MAGSTPPAEVVGRVAVISRDGIGVNERLHRASDVCVFERRGGLVAFLERRRLPTQPGRPFRDYLSLATAIADCSWVVALAINGEARKELTARGFRLHEARGSIETVLRALPADSFSPTTRPPG